MTGESSQATWVSLWPLAHRLSLRGTPTYLIHFHVDICTEARKLLADLWSGGKGDELDEGFSQGSMQVSWTPEPLMCPGLRPTIALRKHLQPLCVSYMHISASSAVALGRHSRSGLLRSGSVGPHGLVPFVTDQLAVMLQSLRKHAPYVSPV